VNPIAQTSIYVLSTRGKHQVCGEVWDWIQAHPGIRREVLEDEESLLGRAVAPELSGARVVIDANLRRMHRRVLKLTASRDLVIFDHDVCQNHIRHSEWYRRYETVLLTLQPKLVIVSSLFLQRRLRERGLNAIYIAKGYSPAVISDIGSPRTIARAFVGRTDHKVYRDRKRMLRVLLRDEGVRILRAPYGPRYNELLNRIEIFVSVDAGFREYMIKNFEAMAAGCVVLAARQGEGEEEALGLVDGENVVLYGSLEEARSRLAWLDSHPDEKRAIAEAGQRLARERHTWHHRADRLEAAVVAPGHAPRRGPRWSERRRLWCL